MQERKGLKAERSAGEAVIIRRKMLVVLKRVVALRVLRSHWILSIF